jgi:uncharacterized protein (DUF111 family)
VTRRALPRREVTVHVMGQPVRVKIASMPNGESRAKAEFDDVAAVAQQSGRPVSEIAAMALSQLERT